jgi:hypothetical protein
MITDDGIDRLLLFSRLFEQLRPALGVDRAQRCAKAATLTGVGMSGEAVALWLGCSVGTVWADLALCRQLVDPQELRRAA